MQEKAALLLSPNTEQACSHISAHARSHINKLVNSPYGSMAVTHHGSLVTKNTELRVPAQICLYAVVAAQTESKITETAPADIWRSEGPDSLHVGLHSRSAHIQPETPNISPLFPIEYADWKESNQFPHVYATPLDVQLEGTYTANAEIGLVAWDWMKEDAEARSQYVYHNTSLEPATFTVRSSFFNAPVKEACNHQLAKTIDPIGTWSKDKDNTTAHLPSDFWQLSFQHNHCQSKYFDLEETKSCLANKRIRIFGDSNERRLVKMLHSSNQWCTEQFGACQSEDLGAPTADIGPGNYFWPRCNNDEIYFGHNTNITFGFSGGLRVSNGCNTLEHLEWIASRRAGKVEPALTEEEDFDIILISVLSWELGFTPLEGYADTLSRLHRAIDAAYPKSRILLREATTVCCRGGVKGSIGMKRTVVFNKMMAEEFAKTDSRYQIIPVSALDGRSFSHGPNSGMWQLGSNHLRSTEIQQEIQMVLNAVCEA